MNGSEIVSFNNVTNGNNNNEVKLNQNWDIVTGNLVGNSQDDILLRNKVSGKMRIWEMNDGEIANIYPIINNNNGNEIKLNQNWDISMVNLIGSSQNDLVLRNNINGNLRLWEMENNQVMSISNLTDSLSANSSLVI
jgi:hypothetical protein